MTAISWRAAKGPRSQGSKRVRRLTRVALVTGGAAILCAIFIMPLIYMASASFQSGGQQSRPNPPLYPAKVKTWVDPNGNPNYVYDLYMVQDASGPGTPSKELALLDPVIMMGGQATTFADPATGQQVKWVGDPSKATLEWEFTLDTSNFSQAWQQIAPNVCLTGQDWCGYPPLVRNTLIIASLGTIGAVLSAILVAYGFARFRFPFRDLLFIVLIGTILLPFQITLIPQYILFNAIGWVGTPLPLIVPHFFANAYNVFLLRQYFMTLPRELDEAAMMDGAGPFRTLVSVIIPQSWPAIISVCLFHFFFAWNDFLGPLIYLSSGASQNWWPISIGLNNFNTTYRNAGAPSVIQAGALISLVLPVAIFFIAQRVFMRGVVISGVEK